MPRWEYEEDESGARRRYPDDPSPPDPQPSPTPPPRDPDPPPPPPSPPPSTRQYTAAEQDFLRRNPGDESRMATALRNDTDPNDDRPPTRTVSPPSPPSDPRLLDWGFTAFNDPYTRQYEGILQGQLGLLRQQQEEMRRQAEAADQLRRAMQEEARRKAEEAAQRRAQATAAWDRFSGYANERVTKLQGPAYTGTEQEVLRTQLLDPIERDRAASLRRATERVSARGMRPESGLAEYLQQLVDQEYNSYRAQAQGGLAQRQIEEQRSREQEAQQLLMLLAQIPDALARGDIDFVNQVQAMVANADTTARRNLDFAQQAQGAVSAPGTQQIAIGDIMAELPTKRLNDALRVLGAAPQGLSPMPNTSAGAIQLLQLLQNQRFGQNNALGNAFGNIGWMFQPGR